MEVIFEVNNDSTPYHVEPYRVPVTQTPLMKRTINKMVENRDPAPYNSDSEWATPIFDVPKN